jgi:hypothetical protein
MEFEMFMPRQVFAFGLASWLMGSAAFALTADQVWQGWQDNATGLGLMLTSDPATTVGGQLTLRNLVLSADAETIFRLPEMSLREAADGTVQVTLPASFDMAPPAVEDMTLSLQVTQSGFGVTISEPSPGARTYDYVADSISLAGEATTMVDLFDGGEKQPDTTVFNVSLGEVSGTYGDTPGTNRSFDGAFAAASLAYDVTQESPYSGQTKQSGAAQDYVMSGRVALPATFDMTAMQGPGQMADALRDGFAVTAEFSQGAGSADQSVTSEFMSFAAEVVQGGSAFTLGFDKTGLTMAGTSQPMSITFTAPDLPFPQADLAFGNSAIDIRLPVIGPEVQDFRYMMKFDSITINEEVWAAFDPTGILERTPIVLDMDVTGRTSLDMFGLMQAEEDGSIPPVPQIERADFVRLLLSGAGAEVAGTGAFTFDNSAGYPIPRGNADLKVSGANTLIDALISLGVITSDEALGARMAMALLLEPTAEPDVMTSKIEAREDGGLYVNGQRMQ